MARIRKTATRVLKKNKHFLRLLPHVYKKFGKVTCDKISCCQMKSLGEIFANLLAGNIPITECERHKLKPFEKELIALSKKRTSTKKKKNILKQYGDGGFLPFLFSAVLPLVLNFISAKK